jgi:hypothetical protein
LPRLARALDKADAQQLGLTDDLAQRRLELFRVNRPKNFQIVADAKGSVLRIELLAKP